MPLVNKSNIGVFFLALSLTLGASFCFLFPVFIRKTSYMMQVMPVFLVGHLLLTLLTYWLSFRDDIRDINENRFSRIKIVIIFFVITPSLIILIVLSIFGELHGSLKAAYRLLILSATILSLVAITLSAFTSIIIWRINSNSKVWSMDVILVLVAALFLLCISFLAYLMAIGLRLT